MRPTRRFGGGYLTLWPEARHSTQTIEHVRDGNTLTGTLIAGAASACSVHAASADKLPLDGIVDEATMSDEPALRLWPYMRKVKRHKRVARRRRRDASGNEAAARRTKPRNRRWPTNDVKLCCQERQRLAAKGGQQGHQREKETGKANEVARNPILATRRSGGVPVTPDGRRFCFEVDLGRCTASGPGREVPERLALVGKFGVSPTSRCERERLQCGTLK